MFLMLHEYMGDKSYRHLASILMLVMLWLYRL